MEQDFPQNLILPWHWSSWRKHSVVIIDLDKYLNGHLNLYAALSAISLKRIKHMQKTLARNANRFIYNTDPSHKTADALDITFAGVAFDLRTSDLFGGKSDFSVAGGSSKRKNREDL
eukprot:gb/GFBE01062590.1/.p1 GENE.gb/GFBE01062590.1/~~gb/GFBE01062590.1/.p1  ORF type:complete len:117 (+),score=27.05 gb/GFBE01062590.1/:1-351(+)